VNFVVFIGHFGKRNRHGHTASDLIWTQCTLFRRRAARQREPLYDPAKSSFFAFLPCSSRLCQDGQLGFMNCSEDNRCVYGSARAGGVLASDTFTFFGGAHCHKVVSLPPLASAAGSSPPAASSIMGRKPSARRARCDGAGSDQVHSSILSNPVETACYYVPLARDESGCASSLAMKLDGTGGTIVDSGSTIAYLVEP
jgi:hypothetical protein